MSFNAVELESKAVGECLSARRGSPASFVLAPERAMLCGRFAQVCEGVGRVCSVCQHFSDRFRQRENIRKIAGRGGQFRRESFGASGGI